MQRRTVSKGPVLPSCGICAEDGLLRLLQSRRPHPVFPAAPALPHGTPSRPLLACLVVWLVFFCMLPPAGRGVVGAAPPACAFGASPHCRFVSPCSGCMGRPLGLQAVLVPSCLPGCCLCFAVLAYVASGRSSGLLAVGWVLLQPRALSAAPYLFGRSLLLLGVAGASGCCSPVGAPEISA